MRRPHEILVRPVISERTVELMEDNKYTFIVAKKANKSEIKKAVEEIFDVTVTRVNTLMVRGKNRRMGRFEGKTPDRKKAIVTLKPGDKIEVFEGL
ncbi:50S ribosomal protein L23 [Metallumcola ferriviriculae]|uniref:Large ribosomal subunit protein uL23 n=1 Tax=Metallumcola ferriviriculae TaxID=3039180 RepID=A0AAU0UJH2_9FIRM|nr:50S ribosomal protein L23 [Desulfitibacteraceae bacterium MK1]